MYSDVYIVHLLHLAFYRITQNNANSLKTPGKLPELSGITCSIAPLFITTKTPSI